MLLQGKAKDQLTPVKEGYSMFALAMQIVPIAIIAIVALMFLITFDVREVAKLVGWPLLVSVLPLVLIAYIGPSALMQSFYESLPSDSMGGRIPPGGGPGAIPLPSADILRIASGFLDPIFSSILTQSLIVLVIAIVLIALTFVLKKKEAKAKEKEEEDENEEVEEPKSKKKSKK